MDIDLKNIFQRKTYTLIFGDSCEPRFWDNADKFYKIQKTKDGKTFLIEPLREEKTNE
jgi:hypothetical protein